ncbi:hypothetical protein BCR33DRAFT_725977 [Rhizoclosmatium globosum]|uniref:Reverse transcriptase domain-containing protein n=1 Tax=Rhizoclosmatium globosum TaxID=329046 RepID=A0A1Y2AVZ8_9FUNG|nr:hypothetical protein BCR33DRAFT_725977 [Rhizoclosmatium globosum]|eukprot:ORY26748.1 hypothetical protein BCR33DRAFT_725977 [Rhizoclosmatium globosum]
MSSEESPGSGSSQAEAVRMGGSAVHSSTKRSTSSANYGTCSTEGFDISGCGEGSSDSSNCSRSYDESSLFESENGTSVQRRGKEGSSDSSCSLCGCTYESDPRNPEVSLQQARLSEHGNGSPDEGGAEDFGDVFGRVPGGDACGVHRLNNVGSSGWAAAVLDDVRFATPGCDMPKVGRSGSNCLPAEVPYRSLSSSHIDIGPAPENTPCPFQALHKCRFRVPSLLNHIKWLESQRLQVLFWVNRWFCPRCFHFNTLTKRNVCSGPECTFSPVCKEGIVSPLFQALPIDADPQVPAMLQAGVPTMASVPKGSRLSVVCILRRRASLAVWRKEGTAEALESVSAQVVFKSNQPSESKLRDVLQSSGVHSASSENEVPLCHPNLIGSHSHFRTAPGRDAGGVGPRLLDALTTVSPPSIAPYIASAGLTPLKKPDNDVRPIAVGMILRRLVSKLGMARYLQSIHQYGVAISGGVEAVLHAFNRIVAERAELLESMFAQVREMCPVLLNWSWLFVGDKSFGSCTGVQQGDPLGPLLFCLVLAVLQKSVYNQCQVMHTDTLQMVAAFDVITREGPSLGLHANLSLFPPETGAQFCRRVSKFSLHDPQCQLLLLRACLGIPKLVGVSDFDAVLRKALTNIFLLTGLPLSSGGLGISQASHLVHYAYVASSAILSSSGLSPFGPMFDSVLVSLSSRLSYPSVDVLRNEVSSSTSPTQKHLAGVFNSVLHKEFLATSGNDLRWFDKSTGRFLPRHQALLQSFTQQHASSFLLALPMEGLHLVMSPVEYRAILRYRLLMPLYTGRRRCRHCEHVMDLFGDHAFCCGGHSGSWSRHNFLRDTLAALVRQVGILCRENGEVRLPSSSGDLWPADLLVYDFYDGKTVCVDISVVHPLTSRGLMGFKVGNAVRGRESTKNEKYLSGCQSIGLEFVPFVLDTTGGLGKSSIQFLEKLRGLMMQREVIRESVSVAVVYRRILFALQHALARNIVSKMEEDFYY